MTATQDTLDVVVDAVLADHRPSRRDSRAAIRDAVIAAAQDRDGLVHIAGVRRHLPAWVDPASIGAAMNRLVRRGHLVPVGKYEPNGGGSRNASKPSPVRRLVKPIPPDALD